MERVPVLRLCETHCRRSENGIVRRLPLIDNTNPGYWRLNNNPHGTPQGPRKISQLF